MISMHYNVFARKWKFQKSALPILFDDKIIDHAVNLKFPLDLKLLLSKILSVRRNTYKVVLYFIQCI